MTTRTTATLALLACAALSCCPGYRLGSGHEDAALLVRGDAFVVDTRTPAEYEMGHIEGAVSIPFNETSAHIDRFPRDRPIVLYCLSGHRSAAALGALRAAGYTNAHDAGRYRCLRRSLRELAVSVSSPRPDTR